MDKIDSGDYIIDKFIYDIYVKHPLNEIGFKIVCAAIDSGGGQTCDVNGVLKALDEAGYKVSCK
jgi:hypothetical protein